MKTSALIEVVRLICYNGAYDDASCSLLMPGMDNTRHFYSIAAVAGTV